MITPSCDEILELAKEYTTIPVCREIYADMTTPISLLRRLQTRSDRFFLLESVEGGEKWARYSFLGYDPILRATCKNGTVTLEGTVNKPLTEHRGSRVSRRSRAVSSATSRMPCSAMLSRRSKSSAAHGMILI